MSDRSLALDTQESVSEDHVPELSGEPEWEYGGLAGYSFTLGYLRAMIRSVQRE